MQNWSEESLVVVESSERLEVCKSTEFGGLVQTGLEFSLYWQSATNHLIEKPNLGEMYIKKVKTPSC